MNNLTHQFNDMDETHLAMSDPIELAKYIMELRGEHQELLDDIENHPDYQNTIDETYECGYDAGRCSVEIADEKDDEIEKNKKELLEQLERITDLKVQNEKLKVFAMKVHNFAFCSKYDDEDIVSSFDLDAILEEMKKDEDKLKEEIETLKEENYKLDISNDCFSVELNYLGKYADIEDYEDFNEYLKNYFDADKYKEIYKEMDMDMRLGITDDEEE